MYASHQLLRVHQDEWLRQAETRRLIKQAAADARDDKRPHRYTRSRRVLFGVVALRRPVRDA